MVKTLNFAHRGFRSQFPENTMTAFEKAVQLGVDGIEFDVHLSCDGVPVIIHDEKLDRTCNAFGFVKDFSFAELRKINAAAHFQPSSSKRSILSEKIPSLEEYCDFIKNTDIISNIELKTGVFEYRGIEEKTYELLKKYNLRERCIISSFNHESVLRMKDIDKSLVCGFLVDSWEINPAQNIRRLGIECYHPCAYRLTKKFVDYMHEYKIKVNAWFGSVQTDYTAVLASGLDAIITDYPDAIKVLLS